MRSFAVSIFAALIAFVSVGTVLAVPAPFASPSNVEQNYGHIKARQGDQQAQQQQQNAAFPGATTAEQAVQVNQPGQFVNPEQQAQQMAMRRQAVPATNQGDANANGRGAGNNDGAAGRMNNQEAAAENNQNGNEFGQDDVNNFAQENNDGANGGGNGGGDGQGADGQQGAMN